MQYRTTRFPADSPVRVLTRAGEQVGYLRNLSAQGVCLSGLDDLRRGEEVRVVLTGQASMAKVMWVRGSVLGLRLARELTEPEMCLIRGIPAGMWRTGPSGHGARVSHGSSRFREM